MLAGCVLVPVLYELSCQVLPGLLALTGDGVPKALVDTQARLLQPFMDQFIVECDAMHYRLKSPLQNEYHKLASGESELVWLTWSLYRQVDDILALCEGTSKLQPADSFWLRMYKNSGNY